MAEFTSSRIERAGRRTVEFRIVTNRGERIMIGPEVENHLRTCGPRISSRNEMASYFAQR